MATERSQQNQAFLDRLERQRRNKPCLRIIDLRGRVSGECQPYLIDGREHYLDDRAYLLLKRLIERQGNGLTVGVYEALMKALKKLDSQQAPAADDDDNARPLLQRLAGDPQILPFDEPVTRREIRIRHNTPLEIHAGEMVYHAGSLDISTQAIRASMKRAYTLQTGQAVNVSFPEFPQQETDPAFTDIPFFIKSIEHTATHSQLILIRETDDHQNFTHWLEQWVAEHSTANSVDLDNALFNIAREFYLRLLCLGLSTPLCWLDDEAKAVRFFHLMPASQPFADKLAGLRPSLFEALPLMTPKPRHPQLVCITDNDLVFTADFADTAAVRGILGQYQQNGRIMLLLEKQPADFAPRSLSETLAIIAQEDKSRAETLQHQLDTVSSVVLISDITALGQHLPALNLPPDTPFPAQTLAPPLPHPRTLKLFISRERERYVINTPIHLQTAHAQFDLTTNEVSTHGLSVKMAGDQKLTPNSRVFVDFTRWDQQSKLDLTRIPYVVRNQTVWQGEKRLGLERMRHNCRPEINAFFDRILEKNRPSLRVRNDDIAQSQQSRLFATELSRHLTETVLFFGMDADNQRILQAVGATAVNQAEALASFWQALSLFAPRLTESIKPFSAEPATSVSLGIYAYRYHDDWQISTDPLLENTQQKSLFIHRALAAPEQLFLHCTLVPVRPETLDAETDLRQQLLGLRRHSGHKVREIRETLHSLFAVGQVRDIRRLIEAIYG